MVLSGPPTPVGGAQSVSPSLIRSNSGLLGAQGGAIPSQTGFPSLVSPRTQYNSMNLIGNMPNVSSLLNQSFGNGGSNSGLSGSGSIQRGGVDTGAESDPLSIAGNGMNFTHSPMSFASPNTANIGLTGQGQGQQFSNPSGNQLVPEQQQSQQLEQQNFQHGQQSLQQFSVPHSHHQQQQQQQQQQQFQAIRGGLGSIGPVKLEQQMTNDQNGQQQQLQSLRSLGQVKLEPQQIQNLRSLGPVKLEPQHSDQSLFLQQQQQQQQYLQMTRQSSQAAAQINLLQQQRILQLQQQQQQQQLLKGLPQQRSQLPQQFQQQSLPVRSTVKTAYEPGTCARRLTHYMYHQQHRPADNNIEFWRKFVTEYFAPNAKKRWCVSLYGSGRQTTGVFPQDVWHCEICNRKPGRGFEATVEVIPRLCKIKYDSGTLEELLYVDMPREYQNAAGQIVLDYAKAIQESVFEQLRVVRDGQLRIVFSSDLKICSWEFCARRHEELIPRRLIIPQVSQLGAAAQKYQAATQNGSSNLSPQELQSNCNMFVSSARQLAKALEVPLVNDLGYTKRYVRCLQISEVVNSMKDLIDYSRETGTGPMASLINFPRRTSSSSGLQSQGQQAEQQQQQQQTMVQNSNNDQSSVQATGVQLTANNTVVSVNNSHNSASTSTSASTIVGLLHQNSMNSRQENSMNNANSPYGASAVQIPSTGSSSSIPQAQTNPSSPFPSPTPSSNNPQNSSHSALPAAAVNATNQMSTANSPATIAMQQPTQSIEADPNDSQSSVQQIIQDMMMSSHQLNGGSSMGGVGSLGNDMKNINGITQTGNNTAFNGGNCLVGNGITNSSGIGSVGFGNMGVGISTPAAASGIRAAMGSNNSMTLNGRVGMPSMSQDPGMNYQQQDLGNRLLSGLGAVNSFNNLQFSWKSSP
ncbi:transcriptional corepressor SEUSS-like isoform X2 [Telopea speciosissima]|uniref:transcriptional corepressor SEUSS-like isoform X2 n=1 Tax=Telopea speciosissima TaxID=54955 RepID=UPI001CC68665|nr:transcriptional corepressor SEUSS-like isoform X2 [Telopea speciosissima]